MPDGDASHGSYIVAQLPDALEVGLDYGTVQLLTEDEHRRVADSPFVFMVDGRDGADDAVVMLSPSDFPCAVSDATARAHAAAQMLEGPTRARVVLPLMEGWHAGRSFAVYTRLAEQSGNRVLRLFQRRMLERYVTAWLKAVATQTVRACGTPAQTVRQFNKPLEHLEAETEMPAAIREHAAQCLARVGAGDIALLACLQHGDLWNRNVLLDPRGNGARNAAAGRFKIIDWGGAKPEGYPVSDVVRYVLSSVRGRRRAATLVRGYAAQVGLSPFEAGLHCMASQGAIGLDPGEFPKARQVALCTKVFGFLSDFGFADA